MAAVTGPAYGFPPPKGSGPRRRWPWISVVPWGVVLLVLSLWSVRNDPPTVPEQRDVRQALAVLGVAYGTVAAAAQDDRWAINLEALRVEKCTITPVRDGQEASREVSLHVPEGDARTALDDVVKGLPAGYRAGVFNGRGGTRLTFSADAGEQVGIEAEATSADHLIRLRVFTGCRPAVDDLEVTDPPAGTAPAVLEGTVAAITARRPVPGADAATVSPGSGGTDPAVPGTVSPGPAPDAGGADATESRATTCPGGGTMSTFVRDAGPAVAGSGPRGLPEGTVPLWSDTGGWAYRSGPESVVVTVDRGRFRVSVTTACRTG